MKLKDISEYCLRNGVLVYEKRDEKDGRKRFYRINVPVFTEGETIPTSNYDYMVRKPKEILEYVNKLLEDYTFRRNTARWVRTWFDVKVN